ncbi:tyrosine-type recombinase/integrase [Candidatus Acetothermia bacterium]|nr:tyrosine-type recombinase/integrase [Candidatus Acetothermia bacterium]
MRQNKQPIPNPADPIKDRRFIRSIKALLKEEGNHAEYLLFTLAINSGLRVSDLTKLTVGDLWTSEGKPKKKVRVKTKKTGAWIEFQLNEAIQEALEFYRRNKESREENDPVFPVTRRTVTRWAKRWCEQAGLEGSNFSAHTLRKTYAYQLWALNGKTHEALTVVQKTLGHKSPGTTLDYLGISREQIEEMQAELNL